MGNSVSCHKKKLKDQIVPQEVKECGKIDLFLGQQQKNEELKFTSHSLVDNNVDNNNLRTSRTSIDNQSNNKHHIVDQLLEGNHLQVINEEPQNSLTESILAQGRQLVQSIQKQSELPQQIIRTQDSVYSKTDQRVGDNQSCNDSGGINDSGPNTSSDDGVEDDDGITEKENEEDECEDLEDQEDEYVIDYVQGEQIEDGKRVLSALNIVNGQLLAVKIYELEEQELDLACYNLNRIQTLVHEHIHDIMAYKLSEGSAGLTNINVVMPFETGGSLQWLLDKFDQFSPHLAAIFFKQILEGLAYLHQQGLIHQNLKPSNVLVDENANAKLNDVNILRKYDITKYSAPECFEGGEYSSHADVWSAGCIFIEMLTELDPWQYQYGKDVTIEQIRDLLKKGELFNLSKIDLPNVQQVLNIIFKKNPEDRLTASQILQLDFFKEGSLESNSQELNQLYHNSTQTLKPFNPLSTLVASSSHETNKHLNANPQKHYQMSRLGSLSKSTQIARSGQTKIYSNKRMSNSIMNFTQQQYGSFVKTLENPNQILKNIMDRRNLIGIDLQSSIDLSDKHPLSQVDLKIVINKKTQTTLNGIIQEDLDDDNGPSSKCLAMNQGILSDLDAQLDKRLTNEINCGTKDIFKFRSQNRIPNGKTKKNINMNSLCGSISSSNHKRSLFASNSQKNQSSQNSGNTNQLSQISIETQKHKKDKQGKRFKLGQIAKFEQKSLDQYIEKEFNKSTQSYIQQDLTQPRQTVGSLNESQNDQNHKPLVQISGHQPSLQKVNQVKQQDQINQQRDQPQIKNAKTDLQKLEDIMMQQFFGQVNVDVSKSNEGQNHEQIESKNKEIKLDEIGYLEQQMAKQFYSASQVTKPNQKFKSQEKETQLQNINHLEQQMAQQFYMISNIGGDQEHPQSQEKVSKSNDLRDLEDLIAQQFYKVQPPIKQEQHEASKKQEIKSDDIGHLEQLMAKQFYFTQSTTGLMIPRDAVSEIRTSDKSLAPSEQQLPIVQDSNKQKPYAIDYSFGCQIQQEIKDIPKIPEQTQQLPQGRKVIVDIFADSSIKLVKEESNLLISKQKKDKSSQRPKNKQDSIELLQEENKKQYLTQIDGSQVDNETQKSKIKQKANKQSSSEKYPPDLGQSCYIQVQSFQVLKNQKTNEIFQYDETPQDISPCYKQMKGLTNDQSQNQSKLVEFEDFVLNTEEAEPTNPNKQSYFFPGKQIQLKSIKALDKEWIAQESLEQWNEKRQKFQEINELNEILNF